MSTHLASVLGEPWVNISATPHWFYGGPPQPYYTLLQGIFTVLAIKEVVSVTRCLVKGSSSALRVRSVVLWHMVENWEDLFKICRQLLFPRRPHSLPSDIYPRRAPLTRLGWKRVVISGLIAFWLFGADVALIFGSFTKLSTINSSQTSNILWSNSGSISAIPFAPIANESFTKNVKLDSIQEGITALSISSPKISLKRTEHKMLLRSQRTKDKGPFSDLRGPKMECNTSELWHVVCTVQTHHRLVRYDLSLSMLETYVPTDGISVLTGGNKIEDYISGIKKQLGINMSMAANVPGYFSIQASNDTGEYITPFPGDRALIHDAIATRFLGTIVLDSTYNDVHYLRKTLSAQFVRADEIGIYAFYQHSFLPLYGTIAIYALLQLGSILQQFSFKHHSSSPELSALIEISGGSCLDNAANISVKDMPVICSFTCEAYSPDDSVAHIGYLPGNVVKNLRKYNNLSGSPGASDEHGIVDTECLRSVTLIA